MECPVCHKECVKSHDVVIAACAGHSTRSTGQQTVSACKEHGVMQIANVYTDRYMRIAHPELMLHEGQYIPVSDDIVNPRIDPPTRRGRLIPPRVKTAPWDKDEEETVNPRIGARNWEDVKSRHKNPHTKEPQRMLISVINESSRVSDADVQRIVEAIGIQLARDVSPIWGLVPAIEFVAKGAQPSGLKCIISDTPDVPGAAGYHDEGPDGLPYIKVFTFDGAPTVVGAQALSVTISHEIIELTLDAAANLWADGKDGADYAREGCDSPEGQTYPINGVSVSNFVYPAFFDPKAPVTMRLDHMGKLTEPFETATDGYQIRRTEPGQIDQVFGKHEAQGHKPVVIHRQGDGDDLYDVGYILVFGKDYPEHKKEGKIQTALRKRAKVTFSKEEVS